MIEAIPVDSLQMQIDGQQAMIEAIPVDSLQSQIDAIGDADF